MFGPRKNKAEKAAQKKEKQKESQSQKLRAEALANMKAAREHIGDETVQKLAEIMQKMDQKENAPTAQARKDIEEADAERVAFEILLMMEGRD